MRTLKLTDFFRQYLQSEPNFGSEVYGYISLNQNIHLPFLCSFLVFIFLFVRPFKKLKSDFYTISHSKSTHFFTMDPGLVYHTLLAKFGTITKEVFFNRMKGGCCCRQCVNYLSNQNYINKSDKIKLTIVNRIWLTVFPVLKLQHQIIKLLVFLVQKHLQI